MGTKTLSYGWEKIEIMINKKTNINCRLQLGTWRAQTSTKANHYICLDTFCESDPLLLLVHESDPDLLQNLMGSSVSHDTPTRKNGKMPPRHHSDVFTVLALTDQQSKNHKYSVYNLYKTDIKNISGKSSHLRG